MPLNFNADFRGPKIDIVTREVPIAAIEKVGDILQDRYDKSYEQYNMFQELAKQTEQILLASVLANCLKPGALPAVHDQPHF